MTENTPYITCDCGDRMTNPVITMADQRTEPGRRRQRVQADRRRSVDRPTVVRSTRAPAPQVEDGPQDR